MEKRPSQKLREYLRPFIKDEYGPKQRETDIDAIVQFINELKP